MNGVALYGFARGVLLTISTCLALASCSPTRHVPPPLPTVQAADGTQIGVVSAGYQTDGEVADPPSPRVLLQGYEPVRVHRGDPFVIHAPNQPSAIHVNFSKDNRPVLQLSQPPWRFPAEPGVYDAEVMVNWGKIEVSADFAVQVE